MKTTRHLTAVFITAAALATAPAPALAADAATGTGIGFALGSPSGLSLKIPQGRANAWQLTLGYDLDGHNHWNGAGNDHDHSSFHLGGDYLWYNYGVIRVSQGRLPLYYGPGLFFGVHHHDGGDDHARLGIRGVIGLEYQFARAPFDIFFEIGPGISVFPDTYGTVFAGLGGRFFF